VEVSGTGNVPEKVEMESILEIGSTYFYLNFNIVDWMGSSLLSLQVQVQTSAL
jgi:hypothetical protein